MYVYGYIRRRNAIVATCAIERSEAFVADHDSCIVCGCGDRNTDSNLEQISQLGQSPTTVEEHYITRVLETN